MIDTAGLAFSKNEAVRLYGKDRQDLRTRVYNRDGGRCVRCGRPVLLATGWWASMHLSHKQGVGAGGSDTEENTESLCLHCHLEGEHNPKPCPSKDGPPITQFRPEVDSNG